MTNTQRDEAVSFDGICGVLSTDTTGDFGGMCKVHIHKDAIANILSFFQLRQLGHSIIYDEGEHPNDDSLRSSTREDGFGSHIGQMASTSTIHVETRPASSLQ